MTTSETNLLTPSSRYQTETIAPAKASEGRGETLPRIVTVLCPVGFTPYATEGLSLDRPLFARVTHGRV